MRNQGQRLVEVDGAGDGLAYVGDQLELFRVPLRLFVKPGRLHRHGELPGGGAQRLHLAPIGAALVRAVVADLEHPGRAAGGVAAERHEDANQVFVLAAFEDLAGERERRRVAGVGVLFFPHQAREHSTQLPAVAVNHGHLGPHHGHGDAARDDVGSIVRGIRAHDDRLPRLGHVDQDVVLGQDPVFLERPARHPRLRAARAGPARSLRRVDRLRRGGAGGHAHHRGLVLIPLVEEVHGREVEVELRDLRVGEVPHDSIDHVMARSARLEHRGGHVAESA